MEITALSLSSGEVMRIVQDRQHEHSVKSVHKALVVKDIDVIILAVCENSNDSTILQKLCNVIQTRYFTGSADGNGFAREYLFSALMDKLKKRCQEFGSKSQCEAINIYHFIGTFYFHILSVSCSRLLRHLESLILVASRHLLEPSSSGKTSHISESLSTWLFKVGPYLNAHFPMTLNSLMDRVRDKFLDNSTTEHARQHLIMLIDCHAREWVIRFN